MLKNTTFRGPGDLPVNAAGMQVVGAGQVGLQLVSPDSSKLTEPTDGYTLADLPMGAPKLADVQVGASARLQRG